MRPFKGGNFLTRGLNEADEALIGFVPRLPLSQQRNAAILNCAPVINTSQLSLLPPNATCL